jgi:hypothetical protein
LTGDESLTVPCTLVFVGLPSGSDRFHATFVGSLGSLTTTLDELVETAPLTVVERLDPSASFGPPSTTSTGTSQTGPDRTVLGTGSTGGQALP